MGQPVKITKLARQMIELSGYVPDRDVPIQFAGLRPGEKLYEELLIDPEQAKRGLPIQEFFTPSNPCQKQRTFSRKWER